MKLKEKLAEIRYGKSKYIGDVIAELARDAFVEGFEKARELALEKVNYHAEGGNIISFLPLEEELENLGEEEITMVIPRDKCKKV